MLRLSYLPSSLAANTAGLAFAYQVNGKSGYAPAGEQRRL